MRTVSRRTLIFGTAAAGAAAVFAEPATAARRAAFPEVIDLPDGFQPEGIATGAAPYAYVTSLVDGSIYRADLRTGEGRVLSAGPGTYRSIGLKVDRYGRLFVAGGQAGNARVVSAATGELLASYQLGATEGSFVNDVLLTRGAAWFTDSFQPALYRLSRGGDVVTVPLTGDLEYVEGYNTNGIVTSPDGTGLIVVQANTGLLFHVDPATGVTRNIDLGDEGVPGGDGLLRLGRNVYVVHNNSVAKLAVNRSGTSARVLNRVTDPRFDWPATVAAYDGRFYLTNARWDTPVEPTTPYTVVAIPIF